MAAKKRKPYKRRKRRPKPPKGFIDLLDLRPRTKRRLKAITFGLQVTAFILLLLLLFPLFKSGFKNVKLPTFSKLKFGAAADQDAPKKKVVTKPKSVKPTPKVVKKPVAQATPVQQAQQITPQVIPQQRVWSSKPKLVFVIDDIGHNLSAEKELRQLGNDIVYAILPFLPHSKYFGDLSRQTGADVILHLPMEAADGTIPGPGLITSRMPEDFVKSQVARGLGSVPNHIGVNNHMGSMGTQNPELMTVVMSELASRNLFFLDSMTSGNSVAWKVGRQMGIPTVRRDVFLDNVDEREAVRGQVHLLARVAAQRGYAIGIGHFRVNTLSVLVEEVPRLEAQGYEIISLSELLNYLGLR